jgi:hypothetical protein
LFRVEPRMRKLSVFRTEACPDERALASFHPVRYFEVAQSRSGGMADAPDSKGKADVSHFRQQIIITKRVTTSFDRKS